MKRIFDVVLGCFLIACGAVLCLSIAYYHWTHDHMTTLQVFKQFFGRYVGAWILLALGTYLTTKK